MEREKGSRNLQVQVVRKKRRQWLLWWWGWLWRWQWWWRCAKSAWQ